MDTEWIIQFAVGRTVPIPTNIEVLSVHILIRLTAAVARSVCVEELAR